MIMRLVLNLSLSCRSKKYGVMYACGHDAYSRTLLGAAVLLRRRVTNLIGTVKLRSQELQAYRACCEHEFFARRPYGWCIRCA